MLAAIDVSGDGTWKKKGRNEEVPSLPLGRQHPLRAVAKELEFWTALTLSSIVRFLVRGVRVMVVRMVGSG